LERHESKPVQYPASVAERWRSPFPRPSNGSLGSNAAGNPLLVDDMVIASTGYGFIYAFNRVDGSIRWSIPKLSGLPPDYAVSPDFDFRPLARTGRLLFAGSLTGILAAYDVETRREVWRRAGPRYISVAFNISSDEHLVYAPYLGGSLVAFDGLTGVERWRTGDKAGAFSFAPLAAGNRLYVASSASGFYALRMMRCLSIGACSLPVNRLRTLQSERQVARHGARRLPAHCHSVGVRGWRCSARHRHDSGPVA
jgi:outer membrane protein assembly factor BamB